MAFALISLGSNLSSNLGDSTQTLYSAIQMIDQIAGVDIDRVSQFYLTQPWGVEDQPEFTNAALGIHTELSPQALLNSLQTIEHQHERKRAQKWGARTLDLDIISYDELNIDTPDLRLPHPYFSERDFVLYPLAEIYADSQINGKPISEWLNDFQQDNPNHSAPQTIKNN